MEIRERERERVGEEKSKRENSGCEPLLVGDGEEDKGYSFILNFPKKDLLFCPSALKTSALY